MPRRKQTRGGDGPDGADSSRSERTVVFERTKMCKFFILGACTKGDECRFAHDRVQLQTLPDLACTKLCKTLIATGTCTNPACSYAHTKEELKPIPDPSTKKPLLLQDMAAKLPPQGVPSAPSNGHPAQPAQTTFDAAVMQAAILHMGQAAQAHAAEANRLQLMAAQLQGGNVSMLQQGLQQQNGGFGFLASLGMQPGQLSLGGVGATGQPQSFQEEAPTQRQVLLAQHFGQPGGLAPAQAGVGLGSQGSQAGRQAQGSLPSLPTDEPVQINTENLRSMSSNSLHVVNEDSDEEDNELLLARGPQWSQVHASAAATLSPPRPLGKSSSLASKAGVTNNAEQHPQSQQKRNDRRKPSQKLGALAEEPPSAGIKDLSAVRPPTAASAPPPQAVSAPTTTQVPSTLGGQVPCSSGEDVGEPTDRWHRSTSGGTGSTTGEPAASAPIFGDPLRSSGITVKNTFLDVSDDKPRTSLRSVQTASGRLDMLGHEASP